MATKAKADAAAPGRAPGAEAEAPSTMVRRALDEQKKVKQVVKDEIAERVRQGLENSQKVATAFENWAPRIPFQSTRELGSYLAPGDRLSETLEVTMAAGLAKMRDAPASQPMGIEPSKGLGTKMVPPPPGSAVDVIGVIPVKDIVLYMPTTLKNEPTPTECAVDEKVAKWITEVEDENGGAAGNVAGNGGAQGAGAGAVPAAAANAGVAQQLGTEALVTSRVNELMAMLSPPEVLPTLKLPPRANLAGVTGTLQSFELRAGPSDVTSYHDFHSIQIAFEYVWSEIFDGRLRGLGEQIYHQYIELMPDVGGQHVQPRPITSIEDLQRLLDDVRRLGDVQQLDDVHSAIAVGAAAGLVGVVAAAMAAAAAAAAQAPAVQGSAVPAQPAVVPSRERLWRLLQEIENILARKYAFKVFAHESYNFGIMVTYRQTWKPEAYQVGDLVSTIPLAPREVLRYTTKRVSKKTRSVKELEDNLRTTKSESSTTSRVEREIVTRAEEKSSFHLGAHESFGGDQYYKIDSTQDATDDKAKISAETKKKFHEAVLKSAQEYRQQNRTEIETTTGDESEDTTFREIQNPNDELPVTYLFYELQRTYRIQEKIHQLRPVILVANEVPAPDAIDDAWLIAHDWIIRRVVLDDSFKPALDYLVKSFVGDELNIQLLDSNAKAQKAVADGIQQQVQKQSALLAVQAIDLANAVNTVARQQAAGDAADTVKRIFDPLGLTGTVKDGEAAGQTLVDFMQETFDRSERDKARLLAELGVATTALQSAIDKLSTAIREHYDKVAEIDRLRIHVKENILYYMQAIWSHEPPDQRFFRVYNIDVSIFEAAPGATAQIMTRPISVNGVPGGSTVIPIQDTAIVHKKLVEVADLDEVLGYKGNYAIYALKQNNLITAHMMQSYIDASEVAKLRDPDDFGNYTVEELKEWAACLYRRDKEAYVRHKDELSKLIKDRLMSGRPEDDRVVVPTTSLYIEALVGTHPLLEDFKLAHRALDVRRAQADVRHVELENIRLAARVMEAEYDDPDVEKKIVIQGTAPAIVPGE